MWKFKITIFIITGILLATATYAAEEPNFTCSIFKAINGSSAEGTLTLAGADSTQQAYELKFVINGQSRQFSGTVYLQGGRVSFTELMPEVQKEITNAINTSRNPKLKTGDLILFSNTKDARESTFNIFLMPSGEMGYLQVGFLQMLCH